MVKMANGFKKVRGRRLSLGGMGADNRNTTWCLLDKSLVKQNKIASALCER